MSSFAGPVLSISNAPVTPVTGGTLVSAVCWIEGTLLGTVATTVAITAMASAGVMMLTGRIHCRRGLTVAVGCFVLFSAPAIAAGLRSAADGIALAAPPSEMVEPQAGAVPPPRAPPPSPSPGYDPYAGASVPMR